MHCQIVVLHVQSNHRTSKAAMQRLHDVWHNFVIFFMIFQCGRWKVSQYLPKLSLSASAKCSVRNPGDAGKPLADVPFSC